MLSYVAWRKLRLLRSTVPSKSRQSYSLRLVRGVVFVGEFPFCPKCGATIEGVVAAPHPVLRFKLKKVVHDWGDLKAELHKGEGDDEEVVYALVDKKSDTSWFMYPAPSAALIHGYDAFESYIRNPEYDDVFDGSITGYRTLHINLRSTGDM